MLVYTGTQNQWFGERINGVAHPVNIETIWNAAQLASIGLEKYSEPLVEPPTADPLSLPINRMQFKATLRINNLLDAVRLAIGAISDPVIRAVAMSKFEENDMYYRGDPLFSTLGAALSLTSAQIDAMWLQALEIE